MGGTTAMQRTSSSTVRTAMAISLGCLVIMTVLYFTKRVESNKTHKDLDLLKLESRDVAEGLNNKLGECLDKMESLTKQTTITGGELNTCKDRQGVMLAEAAKIKSTNEKCQKDQKDALEARTEMEETLKEIQSVRDSAMADQRSCEVELQEKQEEIGDIQTRLDECESEKEILHSHKDAEGRCNAKLAEAEAKLEESSHNEGTLMAQVRAQQEEKERLINKISSMSPTHNQPSYRAPGQGRNQFLPPNNHLNAGRPSNAYTEDMRKRIKAFGVPQLPNAANQDYNDDAKVVDPAKKEEEEDNEGDKGDKEEDDIQLGGGGEAAGEEEINDSKQQI